MIPHFVALHSVQCVASFILYQLFCTALNYNFSEVIVRNIFRLEFSTLVHDRCYLDKLKLLLNEKLKRVGRHNRCIKFKRIAHRTPPPLLLLQP